MTAEYTDAPATGMRPRLASVNGEAAQPPEDVVAEQSVLGGMLLSKDAVADVLEKLRPSDFHRPAHQNIYDAILDLYGRGEPADAVTVAAELDRRGLLRRIGGAPYLHTLISTVPTATNAGWYAAVVAEKAQLRQLTQLGTRISQLGYSGAEGADVAEVVDRAQAEFQALLDGQRPAESKVSTWEALDLGPYLRGEVERPQPSIGLRRSDGIQLIYPGREHAVLGDTESGKTWFALGCVANELTNGNVLYIHYEEGDASSTIERLLAIGVDPALIAARLRFVAPSEPPQREWLQQVLDPAPALVIHDGVNEAMSMLGVEINLAEGASEFRRSLIKPCLRVGAATLACDHLPKSIDGKRRDAYGSIHKGNALDGTRILLVNRAPFGRGMRGTSKVFVTKDRPGYLRTYGQPTDTPGHTYIGNLVIDDAVNGPDFRMNFWAPSDDDDPADRADGTDSQLLATVYDLIAALPDRTVASRRDLFAQMRLAGNRYRDNDVRDAVDDLVAAGRLTEIDGKNRATGYKVVASQGSQI